MACMGLSYSVCFFIGFATANKFATAGQWIEQEANCGFAAIFHSVNLSVSRAFDEDRVCYGLHPLEAGAEPGRAAWSRDQARAPPPSEVLALTLFLLPHL
jgi:hypothetical protein